MPVVFWLCLILPHNVASALSGGHRHKKQSRAPVVTQPQCHQKVPTAGKAFNPIPRAMDPTEEAMRPLNMAKDTAKEARPMPPPRPRHQVVTVEVTAWVLLQQAMVNIR